MAYLGPSQASKKITENGGIFVVRFEVTHHLFGLKKIHAIEFYHLIYLPCIFWRGKQNLSRDLWVNLGKNHVSRKTCPTYLGENIHRAWNRRSCIAQKQICWSFQQETPRWMSRINFHQKFPPQTSWMLFFSYSCSTKMEVKEEVLFFFNNYMLIWMLTLH